MVTMSPAAPWAAYLRFADATGVKYSTVLR